MSAQALCSKMKNECKKLLDVIYIDHNPDPLSGATATTLCKNAISELSDAATTNEMLKTSRGNGNGMQTIHSGMDAFGEIPTVSDDGTQIDIVQQIDAGNGFAPGMPSTWIKRALPDHLRRGKPVRSSDIFDDAHMAFGSGQEILCEPMHVNTKPDWTADDKNFLTGQQIDAYYAGPRVWTTKGYFSGSMITPLCDPRQITIIIQSGTGVIQSTFGLLPYVAGDLIQIPPHTPFCFYVCKKQTVRCITYYAKEDLVFPTSQLNGADLNQAPFSPSIVVQCQYAFDESKQYQQRAEYVRLQQSNGNYNLYYFPQCKSAFNWSKWVHNGPVVHKVNLITNYERIGTSKGHKDPNLWLILGHTCDKSFGIAYISGKSLVAVGEAEDNKITYPPAFWHINGVPEKGELVVFGDREDTGYDAREGYGDGDCLLHVAGVGHGADRGVFKHFINKAIIKHILENKNRDTIIKQLINGNKYGRFMGLNAEKKVDRINGFIKRMYASDFADEYNDAQNVEFNVSSGLNTAIDVILNEDIALNAGRDFQVLGMPLGIGYLMVECRDVPVIPPCRKDSSFNKITPVSYGLDLFPLVDDANKYLEKINKKYIRSSL